MLISVYIIYSWVSTAKEQTDMVVGKRADEAFLDTIREMAETHDPDVVGVDSVKAYHFGPRFLVELEIVMSPQACLVETHDVGIMLQHKIEGLEDVERCTRERVTGRHQDLLGSAPVDVLVVGRFDPNAARDATLTHLMKGARDLNLDKRVFDHAAKIRRVGLGQTSLERGKPSGSRLSKNHRTGRSSVVSTNPSEWSGKCGESTKAFGDAIQSVW